ncbi:MAG: hypothetical protein SFU86_18380 [Pirellulaceae bacterium]|nr:hypothetical protein [Pirellulaceae bacterium]
MSGYPQQAPGVNPFGDRGAVTNPYAAPQAGGYQSPTQPAALAPFAGLWRQGNILVMHKNAPLPDICLKSNQPATRRLKRNLQWHHPLIALTILIGVLIYVVLAIVLTKRATIYIALTDEWFARRRTRMLIAWLSGLGSLALIPLGIALAVNTDQGEYGLLVIPGIIGALAALIAGQALVSMVSPKRMTDEYIWLKGVHPEFLNRLEVWPYTHI